MKFKYELTERLKSVLAVGSTVALFPFLKDWSTEELKALLKDVDAYYTFLETAVDDVWKDTSMQVKYFFNRPASDDLDKQHKKLKIELLAMCSEICSVALYYLNERGEKVEMADDEDER